MLRLSAEWKCFAIKHLKKAEFQLRKTLCGYALRENPAIRIRLRRGFPFFSRKVKFKQAPLLRENSTLSALAGKLARQVLAVTLAKTRFCFAFIYNINHCWKKVFICSYITQNVKVSFTKILGIDIYGNFYQSVHYSGHFIYKRKLTNRYQDF